VLFQNLIEPVKQIWERSKTGRRFLQAKSNSLVDRLRSPGVAGVFLQAFAAIIAVSDFLTLWARVLAVVAILIIATWQAIATANAQRGQERRDQALREYIAALAPPPDPGVVSPANRTLSEFQFAGLVAILSPFRGQRVVILATRGDETAAYAEEFCRVFRAASWWVVGPRPAPTDQVAGNLQLSINNRITADGDLPPDYRAPFMALRSGLDFIGARSRQKFVFDPAVPIGVIVLWVGPKTPANEWPGLRPPLSVGKLNIDSIWDKVKCRLSSIRGSNHVMRA
jgi:hypothetical protein